MTTTTKQEKLDIANTILEQLSPRGINGLRAMLGACNFAAQASGVTFRFKGSRRMNLAQITLNGMDTYDLEFWQVTPGKFRRIDYRNDIYNDNLREVFERVTGLRTGL